MGLCPGPLVLLCCESPKVGIYILQLFPKLVNCTNCLKSWCSREQTLRNSYLFIPSPLTEISVVIKEQNILGAHKIDVNQRMCQREGSIWRWVLKKG